ncbi:hypothetical protein [Phormidium sp. CCY1219]|uniref:hypothetical protein n=1 Tax=Phormidium sp. CCY1219 TaxID=2886104 RepID=UPI002D1EB546|nr:hypothetical protein [Phormidium sp. CCY1219]MEB3831716.1 hypothetical protein [Phormidium sp. CCY1219]
MVKMGKSVNAIAPVGGIITCKTIPKTGHAPAIAPLSTPQATESQTHSLAIAPPLR